MSDQERNGIPKIGVQKMRFRKIHRNGVLDNGTDRNSLIGIRIGGVVRRSVWGADGEDRARFRRSRSLYRTRRGFRYVVEIRCGIRISPIARIGIGVRSRFERGGIRKGLEIFVRGWAGSFENSVYRGSVLELKRRAPVDYSGVEPIKNFRIAVRQDVGAYERKRGAAAGNDG